MSALISVSNKCNIINYQNSTNYGDNDKNSGGDNDNNSDRDNKSDSCAKVTCTLVNHETTEYSWYC